MTRGGAGAGAAAPGRPAPALPAWLATMLPPGARRSLVAVGDGLDVCVTEIGPASGQPVLCLHGNPTWSFLYRRIAGELHRGSPEANVDGPAAPSGMAPPRYPGGAAGHWDGSGLRLVLPDLVGLGFSDKPRDPALHTLENHARWIRSVIDALALGPTVLVVQDWGGPIGLLAFEGHTRDLAGLVVLNTVLSPPRPGFRPTRFHRFARLPCISTVAFHLLGFPQNAVALAQGDRSSVRGAVARAYRYPLRRRADRVAPLALARMVPDSFAHPAIEPLRRVQAIVRGLRRPGRDRLGRRRSGPGTSAQLDRAAPAAGRCDSHLGRPLPAGRSARPHRRRHPPRRRGRRELAVIESRRPSRRASAIFGWLAVALERGAALLAAEAPLHRRAAGAGGDPSPRPGQGRAHQIGQSSPRLGPVAHLVPCA